MSHRVTEQWNTKRLHDNSNSDNSNSYENFQGAISHNIIRN